MHQSTLWKISHLFDVVHFQKKDTKKLNIQQNQGVSDENFLKQLLFKVHLLLYRTVGT